MSWHRKLPNQAACGSCCGIKEKLQTLWDRTINSILRINQVEPDDQGNIRIRSDSEALTITEGTNEIVLDLDTSELPAGVVQSVNGQTGAVVLDGDDIELIQGGVVSVANAVITNGQRLATLQGDLNTEISNRQTADNTLQSNINALQASIPQEAADAVAADPTVQSFAAAAASIPDKVDKRTGAGLRAYTHTGSTQDDTVVEDSTNGATIPIRDANGRLHAADPAAGATDKTLVTANWVSQTGAGRPNNLIHASGNETINDQKLFAKPAVGAIHEAKTNNQNGWRKLLISNTFAAANEDQIAIFDIMDTTSSVGRFGRFRLVARNNHLRNLGLLSGNYEPTALKATIDSNNQVIIWGYYYRTLTAIIYENHAGSNIITFEDSGTIATFNEPTTADYAEVITGA